MSDTDAILFANEAFYAAFSRRDVDAMDVLWAKGRPVSCIHPGWPALDGREEIMKSWRAILSNPQSPRVQCQGAHAYLAGDAAWIVCYEVIEGGALVATNVFVREGGVWKIVHHQAGATPLSVEIAESPTIPGQLQ